MYFTIAGACGIAMCGERLDQAREQRHRVCFSYPDRPDQREAIRRRIAVREVADFVGDPHVGELVREFPCRPRWTPYH
jgi:hypothetical protein